MESYLKLIEGMLGGGTPKQQYEYLQNIYDTLQVIYEANLDVPRIPDFMMRKIEIIIKEKKL